MTNFAPSLTAVVLRSSALQLKSIRATQAEVLIRFRMKTARLSNFTESTLQKNFEQHKIGSDGGKDLGTKP